MEMKHRIAFAGFRHYHILDLYSYCKKSERYEVCGAAEDHSETAADLSDRGVGITHDSVDALFADSDSFDVVAIGDYYGRRGALALSALKLGKHVILDKPICTSLDELDRIEAERRARRLAVGCMLNNRDAGQFRTLKRLIAEKAIGEIHTVSFLGHHPLLYGTRPSWYFEEGKHGGTINDIAIHAIDLLPWLTGKKLQVVEAARVWNSRLAECPGFQVGAQMLLTLEGGAGVMGDVSYLSPDSQGYAVPQYWRYTIHGDAGILETGINIGEVHVWADGKEKPYTVNAESPREGGVFEDFINEIEGNIERCDLTTDQVLLSARQTLEIQRAADTRTFPVALS